MPVMAQAAQRGGAREIELGEGSAQVAGGTIRIAVAVGLLAVLVLVLVQVLLLVVVLLLAVGLLGSTRRNKMRSTTHAAMGCDPPVIGGETGGSGSERGRVREERDRGPSSTVAGASPIRAGRGASVT